MRRFLCIASLVVLAACSRDNASPMTHGAHNKPGDMDSTKTPAQTGNAPSDTASGSGQYGQSSGAPGGVKPAEGGGSTTATTPSGTAAQTSS